MTRRHWIDLDDGTKVMIVDGYAVRSNLDVSFIGGGNPEIDGYIPDNEIWIEDGFGDKDMRAICVHEFTERDLMRSGMSYNKAHAQANQVEAKFRREVYKVASPIGPGSGGKGE